MLFQRTRAFASLIMNTIAFMLPRHLWNNFTNPIIVFNHLQQPQATWTPKERDRNYSHKIDSLPAVLATPPIEKIIPGREIGLVGTSACLTKWEIWSLFIHICMTKLQLHNVVLLDVERRVSLPLSLSVSLPRPEHCPISINYSHSHAELLALPFSLLSAAGPSFQSSLKWYQYFTPVLFHTI